MRKKTIGLILGMSVLVALPQVALATWFDVVSGLDDTTGLPGASVFDIVYNILSWILIIFGAVGVIGFLISGILYLTAAGADDQMEKAKNAMKWSIIGVIVGLSGLVILRAVSNMLAANVGF